jgi:thioesterase domain-containing protein
VVSIERLVEAYYKAIARFRPQGPYRLAGLSFGGILALELASKLRRRGDQVEVVFLLDTMLPQGIRRNWTRWVSRQVADIMTGRGGTKFYRLYTRFRDRIVKRPPEPGARKRVKYVDEAFAIRQGAAFFQASRQWNAHQFISDFPVVLFRGSDRASWGEHTEFDEDYGWRRYLGDRLSIVNVTGDHLSIMRPPSVAELGRKARQFLGSGAAVTLS